MNFRLANQKNLIQALAALYVLEILYIMRHIKNSSLHIQRSRLFELNNISGGEEGV